MALWKVIIEDDAVLMYQKIEARTFLKDFCTRIILGQGGASGYAATPLIVALSPGRSDVTRFRPWSPVATENHLDCA